MKSGTILILDDNQDFAESMADIMEARGFSVDLAFTGEEAVRKFRSRSYDLAFMDVKLPGMNGVESFLEIKKIRPDCKVFMMTAYSADELLRQAINNGALGVLDKPLDVEETLALIDKVGNGEDILIVDDDPDFTEYLSAAIESHGYTVRVAHSGDEGIQMIREHNIGFVVLDVLMPDQNGVEVYQRMASEGLERPTVFVTSPSRLKANIPDLFTSVDEVLYKPIDPEALILKIAEMTTPKKDGTS